MTLLDLQGLETPGAHTAPSDSNLSVALCGDVDSNLSVALCI